MVNRDQLVSEIAQEVIARLQIHLNGGSKPAASAPAPQPDAPKRAPLGDGVFATVDEAVKAAAEAQKKIARLSLEQRGKMTRAIRNICEKRADELGRMEARGDRYRAARSQDREARGHQECRGRRSDAHHGPQRHLRHVHHRARALGGNRHGTARHPFSADNGGERDQHPRGRQRGRLQPASRGVESRGVRPAAFQPRIPEGSRRRQRDHHRGRSEHPGSRRSLPPPRHRASDRHRRPGRRAGRTRRPASASSSPAPATRRSSSTRPPASTTPPDRSSRAARSTTTCSASARSRSSPSTASSTS